MDTNSITWNYTYLGIGNYYDNNFKTIDTYKGRGLDISYLNIKNVVNNDTNTIIIC